MVVAVLTMVVALIGFVTTLILNAFVFDEFDAYGEVPIPGQSSLHLPEGEVTISFHTVVIGGTNGGGLPIPRLGIDITPPEGVPAPQLTEDIGATTTVNNDARVRVWVAQIPAEGTYEITTEGNVGAFLDPRLAFGHGSSYGYLPIVFAALFGFAIVDLIIALVWSSRAKRAQAPSPAFGQYAAPPPSYSSYEPPQSYVPTDQGIRFEQLETLARLRDSGALTHDEFEAEKKRILDGR